ncbi:hypothetical protein LEP1GSC079_3115 [Leptospira interrogans str. FPW1039]|uniref:Uncharacterized protein n=1 Tax=Leptospira interrogans str. FPW1039 TaxID=1193040 RepID=A0A0F6IAM5_LEPIR|nr:hypothetical protein LEP1GSC079_3115 [Leptospira interrogans str. FPW1039]
MEKNTKSISKSFFTNKKAGLLKSGLKHSVIERKLFRFL